MDEKIDDEAQVCRLCGQFESIYIDVFGEEGSKRLLGLKIHSKINILIDETDPLPKTICVQCLGKLEFVCDFQEECLRTQQLLRDRYDLPPLPDIEKGIKLEIPSPTQSSPSTSTTNNNNNEKDRNSTADIENVDPAIDENQNTPQLTTEPARPKRVIKTPVTPRTRKQSNDKEIIQETPELPATTKRWLRSRNSTESSSKLTQPKSKKVKLSIDSSTPSSSDTNIVTRLRSSNQNQQKLTSNSDGKKQLIDDKEKRTIQIPTTALNKVLTAVSTSTDVKVSVKESKNNKNDNEDISFTLELKKKEKKNEQMVTVLAKVFPDQNSALVDSEIINLLDDNSELNKLITTIKSNDCKNNNNNNNSSSNNNNSTTTTAATITTATTTTTTTTTSSSSSNKEKKSKKINKNNNIDDLEKHLSQITDGIGIGNDGKISCNPEELFRIDGEEIRVDDNIESKLVDGQNGYSCKLCKKFYERRDKCTVHVKTHLGIKQFSCTLCTAKFVCKSDVMKHIRCSHTNPRPMQCPKCPKRFRSKFDLKEHDNIHKGVKPYTCDDCGQSYHHKVSLQMHIKSHLPPQNLACEYCGKIFPFRTRLLSHIGSVHLKNRRNFRCRFCYNLYSSLNVLNEHIKARHATTYTCDICSKTFKVSSKYKAHVLQHTNPKPFACNICNNRYASKAFLNEHLLKHEGLRKHICQKCGASFAQASHLAAHRHVHGEKTHACPECGRKFNRRDNMKVHRKRHFADSGRIVSSDKSLVDDGDADEDDTFEEEKIEKNDGLPQAICIRCVGTLEYFVDFQKDCQDTQARLWKEFQERENGFKIGVKTPEIEATSNKENDSSLNSGEATEQIVNLKRKAQPSIESPKCKEKKTLSVSQSDNCESKKLKIDDNVEENQLSEKILSEIPVNKLDKKLSARAEGFQRLFGNTKIQKKNVKKLPVVGKSRKLLQQKVDEKIELKKKINVEKKGENSSDKLTEIKQESNLDESVAEKIPPEIESCQLSPVSNKKYSSAKKLDNKEIKLEKSRISSEPTSQSNSTNEKPTPSISKKITDLQVSTSTEKNIQKSEEEQSIDNENCPKRRKYGSYGKLSDLISQEEKEKIEEHYKIDMSVINAKKVEENISLINDKTIECKICNKKYGRLDKCQVHIWSHFEMKPYKCTECNFATVTVTNIRCHIRKCHLKLKPFTCDICSNKYGTSLSLDEHMNTHTGHKPFSCNYCDYKSASRTVLKYHLSSHKTTKDITCDICKSKFYSKSRLRAHIVTHTKDKNLMCKYCSHYFSTIEGVNKHYKNVHSKDYACPYCDKVTKTKKALNNHLNVHSEAKFKCHLCTNVYKSGHILKEHLLKHEGIRKYKCDVCDKSFAQQSHLAAHKAVHSDKRFSCPGCQRNFNRHDNMKSHAKRCDAFLADPSLMEILNRRSKKLNIKREDEKKEFKKENQPGSVGDDLLNNGLGKIGDSAGREDQENKNSNGKETVLLIDNQKRGIDGNCEKFVTESVIGIEAF